MQEIERRRGLRLFTGGMGLLLIGLGPLLLVVLLLAGLLRTDALGLMRIAAAVALPGLGCWMVAANRRDWLVLRVDDTGLVLRRGRRRWICRWPDVTELAVTTRRNGRITVPTVRVASAGAAPIYLDDVFTLRPPELGALLRRRCLAAGNGLMDAPAPAVPKAIRRPGRGWLVVLPIGGLLILLALARVLHDMHS